MDKQPVHTYYEIPISMQVFTAITKKDAENNWDGTLSNQLDKIHGVHDTDYNGHFGLFIFLNVGSKEDTRETWAKIRKLIEEYSDILI